MSGIRLMIHWFRPICLVLVVLLAACGGGGGGAEVVTSDTPSLPPEVVAPEDDDSINEVEVFKATSPYRDTIATCVKVTSASESCTLSALPILGLEVESPSVQDIMNRVVVSHSWMGTRFEAILNELPAAMLPLFKGITAVVIDDDIRPAYYTTLTGAIYLDPAYIWLTVEEKQTINNKEDPRAGYSDPLQFRSLWRYVDNGERLILSGSLSDDSTRELDSIIKSFAQLLLHELAHANDFIPPSGYDLLETSLPISAAINATEQNRISHRLTASSALLSDTMHSLGQVMFSGVSPSASDLEITATVVGEAFEQDVASDDYAYSNRYEDTAMLFEEAMMKYFFNIDRDIAYTSAPEGDNCSEYLVKWGVRNRIGDSDVKPRALFVVEEIFPSVELSMFFQDLSYPNTMTIDESWCASIDFASTSLTNTQQKPRNRGLNPGEFLRPYL